MSQFNEFLRYSEAALAGAQKSQDEAEKQALFRGH